MENRAEERLDQLLALVRAERIDTTVLEEHFETRLLARLNEQRSSPIPWYALAWRMVPTFAVVAATITIGTFTLAPPRSSDLFAALTADQDEMVSSGYLIGE
ncbi:MAG: hypothetical protein HXX11_12915 [Desulfuromonadales bacterium]|nr:hypothetical protein [Desulfuromonadales bacterium]